MTERKREREKDKRKESKEGVGDSMNKTCFTCMISDMFYCSTEGINANKEAIKKQDNLSIK